MALELQFFPGFKDGDEALSVANTDAYVGGSPMGAYTDGLSVSKLGANFVGMALNDRGQDSQNGKVGIAPRGSKGTLRASLSPSLDKLVIAKGISVGDASLGNSNNKALARSMPVTTANPAPSFVDPVADLGVTKVFPYEAKTYLPGQLLFVNSTTGKWTNVSADSDGISHATVIRVSGEDVVVLTH